MSIPLRTSCRSLLFAVMVAVCGAAHAASPCVSRVRYLQAKADLQEAEVEIRRNHLAQASKLLLEGVRLLGNDYFPEEVSHRIPMFDDTGQSLHLAEMFEYHGKMKAAVDERRGSLSSRLGLTKDFGLCGLKR